MDKDARDNTVRDFLALFRSEGREAAAQFLVARVNTHEPPPRPVEIMALVATVMLELSPIDQGEVAMHIEWRANHPA